MPINSFMDTTETMQRRAVVVLPIIAAIAAMVIVILALLHPTPSVAVGQANGIYIDSRCGEISLRDGTAIWRTGQATYSLHVDKNGQLYAQTDYLVSVEDRDGSCKIASDRYRSPIFLRFDSLNRPSTISMTNTLGNRDYTFARKQ